MHLNSYEFLFVFLPIVVAGFHLLNGRGWSEAAKGWLLLASMVFYGYWNVRYLPVILGSGTLNYAIGRAFHRTSGAKGTEARRRYALLCAGVAVNLALLAYFKYLDFIVDNVNAVARTHIARPHVLLPMGISFFTFTQISYIVDAYRGTAKRASTLDYYLFVSYFPHIIAGPILHHREIIPQFETIKEKVCSYRNLCVGLFLIFIGLFKKVVLADYFVDYADQGYNVAKFLTFIDAWTTSLSYCLYVYFDFSGYTDMALGASLMVNIQLPANFNSPYKALNIQDYWRRWHMTLGRFLRDYVYIPLGGSRGSELMTFRNLVITFVLCGLWHGAAWGYVAWGLMQGVCIALLRQWQKLKIPIPYLVNVFLAFNFFNLSHIPFRSNGWKDMRKVLGGMIGLDGVMLPEFWQGRLGALARAGVTFGNVVTTRSTILMTILGLVIVLCLDNSMEMAARFKPTVRTWLLLAIAAIGGLAGIGRVREFLYFIF
ncbi:MAG: MBOAT family O-acyltransferase [Acidobacteriota bacterium]